MKRPAGDLYRWRRARPALRIDIEIALTPFVEVAAEQDRRLARRDRLGKAVPLIREGDRPPPRGTDTLIRWLTLRDRTEEDQPDDEFGAAPSESARHKKERAPVKMARGAEMLFARIELSGDKPKGFYAHRYISSVRVEYTQEVARPVAIVCLDYYGQFRSVAR